MSIIVRKGGPGSGHWGHAGIPGVWGGSLPKGVTGVAPTTRPRSYLPVYNSDNVFHIMDYVDHNALEMELQESNPDFSPKAANVLVREMVGKCDVYIRAPASVINSIIDDGRLKNQFETQSSMGMLDNEFRDEVENDIFGIDSTDPQDHPIYGYLFDEEGGFIPEDFGLNHYGDVIIKLNGDVKGRTTWTGDDSLDNHESGMMPSSVRNPSYGSLADENGWERTPMPSDPDKEYGYWEAQIHGGVDLLRDVEYVRIPYTVTKPYNTSDYQHIKVGGGSTVSGMGWVSNAAARGYERLKELGIDVQYYNHETRDT